MKQNNLFPFAALAHKCETSTAPHKQVTIRTPQNSIWYHGVANISGDVSASDTRETTPFLRNTEWGRGRADDLTKLKDCILLHNLRLYP